MICGFRSRPVRYVLATALAAQLVWLEYAILAERRFTGIDSKWLLACLTFLLFGAALLSLASIWRPSTRWPRVLVAAGAVYATLRFHIPPLLVRLAAPARHWNTASDAAPAEVRYLRELATAQEQWRLRHRVYASSPDSLAKFTATIPDATVTLRTSGERGWAAQLVRGNRRCFIWVRDPSLRSDATQVEGNPTCGNERRPPGKHIHTVLPDTATDAFLFRTIDVQGTWLQHRADERRSGVAPGSRAGAYSWTVRIAGEPMAPVAIAGNQVFVGAHGNGEFVALSLDKGSVGFRVRVPNWIHHEPVVTKDLVVVTFGNNERSPEQGLAGSEPSGAIAFDRLTGVERWRRYTRGSAMASAVANDSTVIASVSGRRTVAWRLRDGEQAWSAENAGSTAMGNPLAVDSLVLIGLEPTRLCAMSAVSGTRVYCRTLGSKGWGAGHASPATDGSVVLQVIDQGVDERLMLRSIVANRQWRLLMLKILGIPVGSSGFGDDAIGEQVLVALDLRTGTEKWRAPLGVGGRAVIGHVAGTPTITGGVAFVPSPINERIVAVRLADGELLWSTMIKPARGSVLVVDDAVLAATVDSGFVVLDAGTGAVRCRQSLPGASDRAGPTLAGKTAVLPLRNGLVLARPISAWLACRA